MLTQALSACWKATSDARIAVWEKIGCDPGGMPIEWFSSLTEQVPGERIAWRSRPGSMLENAGVVRFTAEGDGTRVDVRHYGWEKLAERIDEVVASYDEGWDAVIARYVEAAGS